MPQARIETKGIGLAVAAGLAFGTLAIFAKLAYDDGAAALPLLAGRFTLAAVILVAYQLATKRSLAAGRLHIARLLMLGAFAYGFEASLFFAALERAPASVVGLIFYSYPMWAALIGFTTGLEPFRTRTLISLALGTVGVAMVFSLPAASPAGMLLALAAAVAVAGYFSLAQVVMRGVDPTAGATWTTIGAAAALLVASAVTRQTVPVAALPELAALGVASSVAFLLLYRALVLIGSTRSSIAMMVEPVATLLLAALILGEPLSYRIGVGAALIVAALPVLASTKGGRARPDA